MAKNGRAGVHSDGGGPTLGPTTACLDTPDPGAVPDAPGIVMPSPAQCRRVSARGADPAGLVPSRVPEGASGCWPHRDGYKQGNGR